MSYSEILCQICGVSFNARRFRTLDEPIEAASGGYGYGSFVEQDDEFDECNDCVAKCRYDRTTVRCPVGCTRGESPEDLALPAKAYCEILRTLRQAPDQHAFLSDDYPLPRCTVCHNPFPWEHIAAPSCTLLSAYNGQNVSADEAKAFNTSQCLVKKQLDWSPEPSDEPFERLGPRYLSGLNDGMPNRRHVLPRVFPHRHGLQNIRAENYVQSNADDLCLPFHPACFEVYKRASLRRFQYIDVAGLIHWWTHSRFDDLLRDQAVVDATCQWWHHSPGQEYLITNPCYIPGLKEILSSSSSEPAAHTLPSPVQGIPSSADVFQCLPHELRYVILTFLRSSDLANLRLASHAFHDLPQIVYQDFLKREKPWLWEMWSDMPYSYWTATTEAEERGLEMEINRLHDHLSRLIQQQEQLVRNFGTNDEILGMAAEMQLLREEFQVLSAENIPVPALNLPDSVDWYKLALGIQSHLRQGRLSGLRNRARIWKDCNAILDRIETYRQEGSLESHQEAAESP